MVRPAKSSDKSSTASKVSVTPVVVVSLTNETSAVATKAPRAKKAKVETTLSAPVEVASTLTNTVVLETAGESVDSSSLVSKMTEFGAKLQQMTSVFATVKNDFKTLEKAVAREVKIAQKASNKKRKTSGQRKPSGFVKPTRISDELAEFLGKTVGTEMARTEVSREINQYIRSNGLQDTTNGRKINPDAKLIKLLKLSKEDELTYFNLQKFMKHHFVKLEGAVATA